MFKSRNLHVYFRNYYNKHAIALYTLKPAANVRKELSKWPCEAVCLPVSSRVPRNFGEKFASRGREENIQHV